MNNYSPQMIEKMDSKWLPLATASILGQALIKQNLSHCFYSTIFRVFSTHSRLFNVPLFAARQRAACGAWAPRSLSENRQPVAGRDCS